MDHFARTITVKHTPSKSPAPKKLYSDQTSKSRRKSLFKENVPITYMVDVLAESTSDDNIVEIATLISSVLSYLKDNNQYDLFNELASR